MSVDAGLSVSAGGAVGITSASVDVSSSTSVAVSTGSLSLDSAAATEVFSGTSLTATTTTLEAHSAEDTALTAGGRVTTTSADATVNVGDTLDVSAANTRLRNSGVVDVFAKEGTRLTSTDMAMSVGDEVQILGGNEVVLTTETLALNADTSAGISARGDGDECERRADGDGRLRHHSDVD